MNVQQNVSLKDYSTMKLGGDARYLSVANTVEELHEHISWAERVNVPFIVIGGGSNIVWQDGGYGGLVIVNKIRGFGVRQIGGKNLTLFTFGAGENWDEAIRKTVDMGYTGLEQLSLIPGTAGAAPVQNIGAYGRELKDVLVSIRAFDSEIKDFVTLLPEQCEFSYRNSIFKSSTKGRYAISSITVRLQKGNPAPPFYASLQTYMDEYHIKEYTPLIVRNAVIAIRASKLPDPKDVPNNGSFFGNPIISEAEFQPLLKKYKTIPHWPTGDGNVKISAAWLIEQSGFAKGYKDASTGMGLWKNQALVLVNENAKSTSDLLNFRHKIISAVTAKFGITLQQEPELI